MSVRELVYQAVKGDPTEHRIAAPYMGNYAIKEAGRNLSLCYSDPIKMAEAQLAAHEIFSQDIIVVQSDNYYMAEAFGAPVVHEDNAMPVLVDAVIQKPKDIHALQKVDPTSDGRMPVYIEAIRLIRERMGNDVAIRGCGTGPFVLAGHLCGIERLLVWLVETEQGIEDHKNALCDLFSQGLETLIGFATAQLEAGADIIQLADSLASLQVISPAMYRTYVLPYEKAFFHTMKPLCEKHHAVSLLHICGNNTAVFDDYASTGADIIAIDHAAKLSEAFRIIDNRACIIGNMNPAGVLLSGSVDDVYEEASECLDASHGYRYMLGTGCEVSVATPRDNMKAMLDSVKRYGSGTNSAGGCDDRF